MKGVFRVKEQKKISLESLVSEIEKNGRIGRLGKVFKTEKNYYFYDTGTGKVAKLNSNVYIVLKSLLEGMPVEDIKNLQLIYLLLRQRKFSIEGAKSYLKNNKNKIDTETQLVHSLTKFKQFLLELKSSLSN
jgi:hypothetical protein